MTVSATMIAQISEYTVGDSGTFTETDFTYYKTVAGKILDTDDPGLETELYDYCHALLICHLYYQSKNESEYSEKKVGPVTIKRNISTNRFKRQYDEIIGSFAETVDYSSEANVTRNDANVTAFKFDQNDRNTVDLI